jgi:hypothetical protein
MQYHVTIAMIFFVATDQYNVVGGTCIWWAFERTKILFEIFIF